MLKLRAKTTSSLNFENKKLRKWVNGNFTKHLVIKTTYSNINSQCEILESQIFVIISKGFQLEFWVSKFLRLTARVPGVHEKIRMISELKTFTPRLRKKLFEIKFVKNFSQLRKIEKKYPLISVPTDEVKKHRVKKKLIWRLKKIPNARKGAYFWNSLFSCHLDVSNFQSGYFSTENKVN